MHNLSVNFLVYETLIQTSTSPSCLFAFEYYRSFLSVYEKEGSGVFINSGSQQQTSLLGILPMIVTPSASTTSTVAAAAAASSSQTEVIRFSKKERRIGRGHKKALVRWYTAKSELELLSLVTKHKHSHSWTNKDLFKLIHMKPCNEGIDFVMKYVMFGYEKIKDEKLPEQFAYLSSFVHDLENVIIYYITYIFLIIYSSLI